MAPEVLSEGVVSFASDIWSLGVLIYVIACGELPYEVDNERETSEFYRAPKKYLKARQRWKRMSRVLRRLVLDMMDLNPQNRLTIGAALQSPCFPGRARTAEKDN